MMQDSQKQYEKLIYLLKTAASAQEIDRQREEVARLIPKVRIMFSYDQKNRAHQYDLWNHCLHTVLYLPRNLEDDMLYLAALLHDIGKPDCQVKGKREDDTNMHYYGHPMRSYEIVKEEVIPGLLEQGINLSKEQQERLLYYVRNHDDRVSLRLNHLRRHLELATFEEFQRLMILQVADAKAHVEIPIVKQRIEICSTWAGEYGKEQLARIQNGE